MTELLTLNDFRKKIAPPDNCPESYLKELDEIPDPPEYVSRKKAESWYRLCTIMQEKGSLNAWNTIVLEAFIAAVPKLLISDLPADKEIMKAYINQIYTCYDNQEKAYSVN